MDKIELQKPLEHPEGNIQLTFGKIARTLFNNFCIECGKKTYYFAEIEFYYYKEGVLCDTITYKRNGYNVGDLFFHLSGVDICFDSTLDEYGGILIRSIYDAERNMVITGPMNSLVAMLNSCENNVMPKLKENNLSRVVSIESTYRYFGDDDRKKILNRIRNVKNSDQKNKDGDNQFAFYDASIEKDKWDTINESGKKKYYYTHRFVYK